MTRGAPVRVLVAEDHPLYRDALVRTVDETPELELVASAADGATALAEIKRLDPDVAVLDLRMPSLDGLAVLERLRETRTSTRVLVLSGHNEASLVHAAVEAGAAGYLLKEAGEDELRRAMVAVSRGETALSDVLTSALFDEIKERAPEQGDVLSGREREILMLIAAGHSNAEIGDRLHLSPATVKTYLRRACEKLEVNDRASAVAEAIRRGLLD
jgi:two-component system, NarL family, nitrate/nitrite response regulator NarL